MSLSLIFIDLNTKRSRSRFLYSRFNAAAAQRHHRCHHTNTSNTHLLHVTPSSSLSSTIYCRVFFFKLPITWADSWFLTRNENVITTIIINGLGFFFHFSSLLSVLFSCHSSRVFGWAKLAWVWVWGRAERAIVFKNTSNINDIMCRVAILPIALIEVLNSILSSASSVRWMKHTHTRSHINTFSVFTGKSATRKARMPYARRQRMKEKSNNLVCNDEYVKLTCWSDILCFVIWHMTWKGLDDVRKSIAFLLKMKTKENISIVFYDTFWRCAFLPWAPRFCHVHNDIQFCLILMCCVCVRILLCHFVWFHNGKWCWYFWHCQRHSSLNSFCSIVCVASGQKADTENHSTFFNYSFKFQFQSVWATGTNESKRITFLHAAVGETLIIMQCMHRRFFESTSSPVLSFNSTDAFSGCHCFSLFIPTFCSLALFTWYVHLVKYFTPCTRTVKRLKAVYWSFLA